MKNVRSARTDRLIQNAKKNQFIFERLAIRNDGELMRELLSIRNTYFPTEPQSLNTLPKKWDRKHMSIPKKLISATWRIIDSWKEESRSKFLGEIESMVIKYKLGKEWIDFFITYLATGVPCLPIYNLYFDRKIRPNIRLILELNPDTSIEDLKDAMPEIEALTKSRWPNYQRSYFTKNSFVKLHDTLKIQREKKADPKRRRAGSYEEIVAKQKSPEEAKKIILGHRKGLKEDGKHKGPIERYIRKKKLTDADIAKRRGLQGVALKNAVDRIRQDRKRQKMTN